MQRGITGVFILIIFAVLISVAAIGFGYFALSENNLPGYTSEQTVTLPPENLIPPPELPVGTPECPDTDYTGCDNTSLWMTWDGPAENPTSGISTEGTLYSK